MKSRVVFVIGFVLFVAAGLAAAAQWFGPPLVARQLEQRIADEFDQHGPVTVNIHTFPIVRLLWGHVDTVTIDVQNPRWHALNWSGFKLHGQGLRFDRRQLWAGTLHMTAADTLELALTISEADLEQYLYATVTELDRVQVSLFDERVHLSGHAVMLGRTFKWQSEGTVELENGAGGMVLRYVPEQLAVEGESVPNLLLLLLRPLLQQTIDLSAVPLALTWDDVIIRDGYAVVHGTMVP